MEPVEIRSLDVGIQTVGLMERSGSTGFGSRWAGMAVPLGMIDMVVIPGLAF